MLVSRVPKTKATTNRTTGLLLSTITLVRDPEHWEALRPQPSYGNVKRQPRSNPDIGISG
jgi:hypothetical protein